MRAFGYPMKYSVPFSSDGCIFQLIKICMNIYNLLKTMIFVNQYFQKGGTSESANN